MRSGNAFIQPIDREGDGYVLVNEQETASLSWNPLCHGSTNQGPLLNQPC